MRAIVYNRHICTDHLAMTYDSEGRLYCGANPIMNTDPTGEQLKTFNNSNGQTVYIIKDTESEDNYKQFLLSGLRISIGGKEGTRYASGMILEPIQMEQ